MNNTTITNDNGDVMIISDFCIQTLPCKHSVKINNGQFKLMSGDDIYKYIKENGFKMDKHFQEYA